MRPDGTEAYATFYTPNNLAWAGEGLDASEGRGRGSGEARARAPHYPPPDSWNLENLSVKGSVLGSRRREGVGARAYPPNPQILENERGKV